MKINWKARFKNRVFLLAFIPAAIAFIYQVLSIFGVVPSVSENEIVNIITMLVNLLAFVGIVVDPTTEGLNDSERAMLYFTEFDEGEFE